MCSNMVFCVWYISNYMYLNDRLNLWYSLCNPESCSHSVVELRPHFHVCWSFHMFQTNRSVPNRTRLTCVVKDTNYHNSQIEWWECSSLSDSHFVVGQTEVEEKTSQYYKYLQAFGAIFTSSFWALVSTSAIFISTLLADLQSINNATSVFHVSVLLLIMNFVITLLN